MRVVAGQARGRVLRAPTGTATRPTSDRVRESIFDILTSMDVIEGAAVVDLFAGSGALGIEALSRGAASVTFVDNNRAATDAIGANLMVLGDRSGLARIVRADALEWARRPPPRPNIGVVFADPPYAWPRWDELLGSLAPMAALVVAETGQPLTAGPEWENVRSRRYGSTVVTILRPRATAGLSSQPGPPAPDLQRGGN